MQRDPREVTFQKPRHLRRVLVHDELSAALERPARGLHYLIALLRGKKRKRDTRNHRIDPGGSELGKFFRNFENVTLDDVQSLVADLIEVADEVFRDLDADDFAF